MNRLDEQYRAILGELLYNGKKKGDRTGTGTLSKFGIQIRHRMSDGFPLLTTKKMAVKTMMTELKWFLKGDTNIKYLVDNGCHIWNGDAYKVYKTKYGYEDIDAPLSMGEFITKIKTDNKFAKQWGELGPIYGKQWRGWTTDSEYIDGETYFKYQPIDQIKNLINDLKTNPDSRRLMVNAWNVSDLPTMALPPCHYGFQVYTRELSKGERRNLVKTRKSKLSAISEQDYVTYDIPTRAISLSWNQRSVDTFLGLPFNIASYGLLLEIIAKEVNMVPDELIGNLGDTHLYLNHIEQAKEQVNREPYNLPTIELSNIDIFNGEWDYEIKGYEYHPTIKAPLSN